MTTRDATTEEAPGRESPLRRLLLWVTLVGIAGLLAELVLLEHWGSTTQWIPFVSLAAGLVAVVAMLRRPTRAAARALRAIAVAFVAAGAAGVWLHFDGNLEFEREDDPTARGIELARRSIFGATPLLAPGALVQLGLIALCVVYRHPALRGRTDTTVPTGTGIPSQETR